MPKSHRSNSVTSTESRRRRPSRHGPPSPTDPTCPYSRTQSIASAIAQRWASEPESVRQAYSEAERDVVEEFEVEELLMRSAKARKRIRAQRAKWIATHEPIVLIEMEMQELGALSSEQESTESEVRVGEEVLQEWAGDMQGTEGGRSAQLPESQAGVGVEEGPDVSSRGQTNVSRRVAYPWSTDD